MEITFSCSEVAQVQLRDVSGGCFLAKEPNLPNQLLWFVLSLHLESDGVWVLSWLKEQWKRKIKKNQLKVQQLFLWKCYIPNSNKVPKKEILAINHDILCKMTKIWKNWQLPQKNCATNSTPVTFLISYDPYIKI